MASLIADLEIDVVGVDGSYSQLSFKFSTITGYTIGGYKIYKYYSTISSGIYDRMVVCNDLNDSEEVEISYTEGDYTYFNYYVNVEDYGREIYFSVAPVTVTWEELQQSALVLVNTPPNQPDSFIVSYDNYNVVARWAAPTSTDSSNTNITNYSLKRANSILLSNTIVNEDGNLYHTSFIVGIRVFVIDTVKKSYWYGLCQSSGIFILDDSTKFSLVYDISGDYEPSLNNIRVYIEDAFEEISQVAASEYTTTDNAFNKDNLYFYSLCAVNNQIEGLKLYYPLYTVDIVKTVPYLRNITNSESTYLSSVFWKKLKNVLIDNNYYNKQTFDIPHIKGMYTFTGFIGVYNAKVDVYINGTYTLTTITDLTGSFIFSIHLTKSNSVLQLHARDYKNVGFSIKSTPQIIRLVNIYSFFSALSQEYDAIWSEILSQFDDFYFTTSRIDLLENKLSPFTDFLKDISETDENYKNFIVEAFLCYEYAGFKQGLTMILDIMESVIDEFDHYEIYFKDSLMDTLKTGYTFIISDKDHQIDRKNYIYAITSAHSNGQESSPSIIRIDNRWWPTSTGLYSSTGYYSYNALIWDEAVGANLYNIYRQETSTGEYNTSDFEFICTTSNNIFVDVNANTLEDRQPPIYNLSTFLPPKNLVCINGIQISNRYTSKKIKNWIRIVIYQKATLSIPNFYLDRLILLLADLIPPEVGYTVIICNDEVSEVLI